MTFKRILTGSFIIMICVMMFLTGYTRVTSSYCYASSTEWEECNLDDQAQAFLYYCKSRSLIIEGSTLDALTTFTTETYYKLCKGLGINVTSLQSQIKKATFDNTGIKFLFSSVGMNAMNRIFAEFLQNNDLSVGDTVNNKVLYSGIYFTDKNGNKCLCFVVKGAVNNSDDSNIVYYGTPLKYTSDDLLTLYLNETQYLINYTSDLSVSGYVRRNTKGWLYLSGTPSGNPNVYNSSTGVDCKGYFSCFYRQDTQKFYGGTFSHYINGTASSYTAPWYRVVFTNELTGSSSQKQNVNINVNSNNTTINNNTYNSNYTIINNEGDHTGYDTEPNPNEIPDDPYTPPYDPYPGGGGTTTPDDNVGGGDQSDDTNITFPNFEFNFPEIDWSIGDLSQKFPFSIPFDLISFFTVLNADPEAPKIDANIPLGSWYTWHFEADFSQFDRYASIVRHVEFISFVVALIYLTIRLVKG